MSDGESFQETANPLGPAKTFHHSITKYDLSPKCDLVGFLVQRVVELPDHLFHLVKADHKAPVQAVCDALSTDHLENRL